MKDLFPCDPVNDCNRSIITCLAAGREPPAENIHISSLPPSVPTDPEPQQTGGQGNHVCFVHRSLFFVPARHSFYEISCRS